MTRRTIHELSYPQILNNVLPPTIRILGWCPVTPTFSARFSCSDRTYRYHFVRRHLDLAKMDEALGKLVGRHDFRNLCKMNVEQVTNFERVVKSARIVVPPNGGDGDGGGGGNGGSSGADNVAGEYRRRREEVCHVEIVGQAFLWHQIRCIVAVLFMVGSGLEPPSVIDSLLDVRSNPGKPAYAMASELPLVLHDCSYGDRVRFRRSVRNLWGVCCDLERRWEELTLAAARIRDGLDGLMEGTVLVSTEDLAAFVEEVEKERRRKGNRRGGTAAAATTTTTISGGKRRREEGGGGEKGEEDEDEDGGTSAGASGASGSTVTWADALAEIESRLGIRPGPAGPREVLHVPLLERSRGTTYEEKIRAIRSAGGGNSKRRERFEDNTVKKRKTDEEDRALYERMLRQGGTGS